jgi:5-methyltetrahydrofolate--homocysteine methyltransferase
MKVERFIGVGENIHCTRVYKVGGQYVKADEAGGHFIAYRRDGKPARLAVPELFRKSGDWEAGKLRHCAAAVWQGLYGEREAGVAYLQALAREQEAAGAAYLDVNVDEFSLDLAEKERAMRWIVDVVQKAVRIPVSVDTSSVRVLRAGLEACDRSRARPMVNSVSLERAEAIPVAAEFGAVVIASAAGEKDLPSTVEDRLNNVSRLMERLWKAGLRPGDVHVDPLVFPISTDGENGKRFLASVSALRAKYGPEIHIVAGLSNISFGMPSRKLINQVFTWLAVEAGADGGIVDPMQINAKILSGLDPASEGFRLARALLLGEDEYGMEFIGAAREGRV